MLADDHRLSSRLERERRAGIGGTAHRLRQSKGPVPDKPALRMIALFARAQARGSSGALRFSGMTGAVCAVRRDNGHRKRGP